MQSKEGFAVRSVSHRCLAPGSNPNPREICFAWSAIDRTHILYLHLERTIVFRANGSIWDFGSVKILSQSIEKRRSRSL
jgi:hypothetical protein